VDHDADHVMIFADPNTPVDFCAAGPDFPPGTTLVMAEYADEGCTDLVRYTAMSKDPPGALPGQPGWTYEMLNASMRVIEPNKVSTCSSCHMDAPFCP